MVVHSEFCPVCVQGTVAFLEERLTKAFSEDPTCVYVIDAGNGSVEVMMYFCEWDCVCVCMCVCVCVCVC